MTCATKRLARYILANLPPEARLRVTIHAARNYVLTPMPRSST